MKTLLFTIAAICLMALQGLAQKTAFANGLRKADLPVVYLPDSLSLHFISPEPIQYVDISSRGIAADLPLKNVLRIRYRRDSSKLLPRDAVVTVAGEKFIAQYHVLWSPPNGGAVRSEIEIAPEDTRPLDIGITLSQPELSKLSAGLFCRYPEAGLETAKAYGIRLRLDHVSTLGDYIFLDVSCDNRTRLNYDIETFRFRIDDKKITKATTVQSLEIKPVFTLLDQPGFTRHYRNVFVFKKFTFPGNKVLHIEMNEKQLSGRVIALGIPYSRILGADVMPGIKTP